MSFSSKLFSDCQTSDFSDRIVCDGWSSRNFFTVRALSPGSVSPTEPVLKRLDQTDPKLVLNSLNWNIKEIQGNHMAFREKIQTKMF